MSSGTAHPKGTLRALRNDPVARRIILAWRRLTAESAPRTLVACSGGGDSVALGVALAAAQPDAVTLAHIVHDMRPIEQAERDRDFVRALAVRLGIPFLEQRITSAPGSTPGKIPGNPEAMARKARYRALADLAREADTPWVATGHTADDQFETIIMSLIRGVGPDGMRAIARRRRLEPDLRLIRPMLHITRDEARALLERADILWCEDHTNLDTTRLRAALRHAPLAQIESIRPGASRRASYSADLIHQASLVVRDRVEQVFPKGACSWSRDSLRAERPIVLGAGLRRTALRLTQGTGADRLGRKVVAPCIRAIRDGSTEPRRFPWPRDILVTVTTHEVRMERPRRPD